MSFLFGVNKSEAARDEQKQRSDSVGSKALQRHQHRHDQAACAKVYQDCHSQDGCHHHEPRGNRGKFAVCYLQTFCIVDVTYKKKELNILLQYRPTCAKILGCLSFILQKLIICNFNKLCSLLPKNGKVEEFMIFMLLSSLLFLVMIQGIIVILTDPW